MGALSDGRWYCHIVVQRCVFLSLSLSLIEKSGLSYGAPLSTMSAGWTVPSFPPPPALPPPPRAPKRLTSTAQSLSPLSTHPWPVLLFVLYCMYVPWTCMRLSRTDENGPSSSASSGRSGSAVHWAFTAMLTRHGKISGSTTCGPSAAHRGRGINFVAVSGFSADTRSSATDSRRGSTRSSTSWLQVVEYDAKIYGKESLLWLLMTEKLKIVWIAISFPPRLFAL